MFIHYGETDLTKYIKVRNVKRPLMSERENYTLSMPSLEGEVYSGHKYKPKTIEIDFALITKDNLTFFRFIEELGRALNVDQPTRLIIGDEPNKYYLAVIDGVTDIDKILSNGFGTLTFLCADPVAYSLEPSIFDFEGVGDFTVHNTGTTKTHPIIRTTFSNDAHFFQATNEVGQTVLIGNRPDVEKSSMPSVLEVLHEPCDTTAKFTATGNVLDSDREITGNCSVNTGSYGICCNNYGTGDKWHGGALRRNIGQNLEEFEVIVEMEHDSKGTVKGQGSTSTTPPANGGTYKCTAKPSLRIRSGRGTGYKKLGSIPYGKTVKVTEISNGWGKVVYGKVTGYSSMTYLSLVSSAKNVKAASSETEEEPSAENRQGRMEVYLFDENSQKLGKFVLKDTYIWYEYTEPEIYIGNKRVLDDKSTPPTPQTTTTKLEDGTKVTSNTDSGKFGKWNEFKGTFKLRREKQGNDYVWSCEVNKISNGSTVRTLASNTLKESSFPTGKLNHIVIWFGQWSDKPVVDTMTVTDIKVNKVNNLENPPMNEILFHAGDELLVDFRKNSIELNSEPFMDRLNIGSKFFAVPQGDSQLTLLSDDNEMDSAVGLTEKWI